MEASLSYSYAQSTIGAAVVDQLRRTRGWVLMFGVLTWIGGAFMGLAGGVMLIMGLVGGFAAKASEEGDSPLSLEWGGVSLAIVGLMYFALAFIYIYPALKLTKYAGRIRDLMEAPAEQNLVAALNEQRAFWKYCGVTFIVMIALYAIVTVVMVGVTMLGAAAASMG